MSARTKEMDDRLYRYLLETGMREPEVMRRLREETDTLEMARMRSSPEQVQFLSLLLKTIGASNVLEVGTFTGYATLGFAQALPADGQVVTLDVSEEWSSIGQRYWQEAGVAERIDLRLAPAADSLEALVRDGATGQFDLAFIDADKVNYDTYYECALTLLRQGGIVAIDNVFWSGNVVDPDADDDDTTAIRALNAKVHDDKRVDLAMLPIGDGLTLARKR